GIETPEYQQYGAILPIELTTEDIRNTKAYKEYYACATGEAAPKPKANARRKRGGSASSTTPTNPTATPIPITIVEMHISQQGGSSTDKGTGSRPGVPDVPSDDSEEEILWNSSDDEDVDDQTKGRDESECEKTDESDDYDDDQKEAEKSSEGADEETKSAGESIESIFTTRSSRVTPIPSPKSTMTPSIITITTTASQPPIPPTAISSAEDRPIVQTSHHPKWFSQPRKPPTPDRDWNQTLPAVQGSAQNSKAYKEFYACSMGEAAPKPKASARKKKGKSASSTTPPTPTPTTTVESAPRLSVTAKGKQPSRAITPTEPTDVQRIEAKQLKIVLKRSRQETQISQ
nr:hypothetical protein [Tanacetum cinerariifolium]